MFYNKNPLDSHEQRRLIDKYNIVFLRVIICSRYCVIILYGLKNVSIKKEGWE